MTWYDCSICKTITVDCGNGNWHIILQMVNSNCQIFCHKPRRGQVILGIEKDRSLNPDPWIQIFAKKIRCIPQVWKFWNLKPCSGIVCKRIIITKSDILKKFDIYWSTTSTSWSEAFDFYSRRQNLKLAPNFLPKWTVVVEQLVERSLPMPEIRGSNPVISSFIQYLSTIL